MRIQQLRAFASVAESKSFTRAAERLYLSQPAVYQQVRQLEREFGFPLVHVVGKEVRLTAAGSHVYAFARETTGSLDRLESLLDVLRASEGKRVRIGAASYFGPVAWAAERIRARQPDFAVDFTTLKPAAAVEALRRNEIDFAFFGRGFVPDGLDAEPCGKNLIIPVAVPHHPFASRRRLSARTFFSTPVISYAGSSAKLAVDSWLEAHGIRSVSYAAQSDSSLAIKAMAISLGVPALVVKHAIYHELVHGLLVELPVTGMNIGYELFVVYRKEWLSSAGLELLQELRALEAEDTTSVIHLPS